MTPLTTKHWGREQLDTWGPKLNHSWPLANPDSDGCWFAQLYIKQSPLYIPPTGMVCCSKWKLKRSISQYTTCPHMPLTGKILGVCRSPWKVPDAQKASIWCPCDGLYNTFSPTPPGRLGWVSPGDYTPPAVQLPPPQQLLENGSVSCGLHFPAPACRGHLCQARDSGCTRARNQLLERAFFNFLHNSEGLFLTCQMHPSPGNICPVL